MNLDEVRVKINDINDQMLELFKERMELSKDVAAAKKEMNKAIYDAKRERDILDKVTRDAGPDLDLYARRFFEALFSLSRTYQSEQLFQDNEFTVKMKKAIEQSPTLPPQRGSVACAGVFGSNAQVACDKLLPLSQIHYVTGFRAVFDAVESGECQFGGFTREKRHKTRRYSHYHLPSSSVGPMQSLPRKIRRRRIALLR